MKTISDPVKFLTLIISCFMFFALSASVHADIVYEGCRFNKDCNDGVFCNGEEICHVTKQRNSKGNIVKEHGVCEAGSNPCERGWQCRNAGEDSECLRPCEDRDGDGYKAMSCGGNDCDDRDPNRFPGNPEICDANGIDEDCDPNTVGDTDKYGDGFLSPLCR